MVQQLGPYLTFEPWTWGWDGIAGYQHRIMEEEKLYGDSHEHKRSNSAEKLEQAVSNLGHWIWEIGKQTLGLSKQVKMVPVNPDMIRLPQEPKDNKDINWGVGKYTDSYTLIYRVLSAPVNRTPGACMDRSKEGGELLRNLGETNEYIHPAVWRRYETKDPDTKKPIYKSDALHGFERIQDPKYGSRGWYNEKEKLWIPEWFIKPTDAYLVESGLKHGEWTVHTEWEHAEWEYTENVHDSDDLQKHIARFYVDAMEAQKKMEADGKKFPFEVTI